MNFGVHDLFLSVDSDKIQRSRSIANSLAWYQPGNHVKLRCQNNNWTLLVEVSELCEPRELLGSLPDQLRNQDPTYRVAPKTSTLARQLCDAVASGVDDALFLEGLSHAVIRSSAHTITGQPELGELTTRLPGDPRLRRAVDFIESECHRQITAADIAKAAAMSPSWFQSAFKSTMGMTVFAYVRERRLDRAKSILQTSRTDVGTIAHQCGFTSHAAFSRAFRAHYGCPPSAVR